MTAQGLATQPACHSIVIRLPRPADEAIIQDRLAIAAERLPLLAGVRIWHEYVTYSLGGELSSGLLEREARRELFPGGRGLRLVCIHYPDGESSAVAVADRAVFSHDALLYLAATLRSEQGCLAARDVRAAAPVPGSTAVATIRRRPVSWGVPEPGRAAELGIVKMDFPAIPVVKDHVFIAAVALVLARYEGGVAAVAVDDRATAVMRPDENESVRAFLERVGKVGRSSGVVTDEPAVARIVTAAHHPDLSYLPDLTPWPMTICADFAGERAVSGTWWFDEGAIHPAVAAPFARHTVHVATQLAAASPDAALSCIELLTADETAAILAVGATPAASGTRPRTIHDAFRAVAARFPDRPAVSDEQQVLTYHELSELAKGRARGLRSIGVRPGDMVGVCQDRTADLVVTMLAVLMAGAAYVPLDPHHPPGRLSYIAADAGLDLVLTDNDDFPAVTGVRVVASAGLSPRAPLDDCAYVADPAEPGDTAYVIYTSGSTGRPKGVVVPHRCVHALIASVGDFRLDERDVWTLFHASSFDFSVWEIWGCLLTGGRLVVVPYMVTRSPDEFHSLLARERVTVLSQTPSAFAGLRVADARSDAVLAVRLVVLGGETLSVAMVADWFARHPSADCRVVNMFGITETTVHVTAMTVTPAHVRGRSRSVGRALPGWSVSVRDQLGRLLPLGIPGEVYVGGAGVALGYHGRAELTAQRFVDDPLAGERVYRSGDRGRLRPDGSLDHLGRLDSQVKIRGFRIELDEIRSVLLADPAVESAVVAVEDDTDDAADVRIRAYVILNSSGTVPQLRQRVSELLPEYMVPATIQAVRHIPLTANGKLDTARLLALEPRSADGRHDDGSGADEITATVLRIWREVLMAPVQPEDDFFEHGGNSLLAVRVLQAMHDAGLPSVPVRDLYRNRSVAGLAALIRAYPAP